MLNQSEYGLRRPDVEHFRRFSSTFKPKSLVPRCYSFEPPPGGEHFEMNLSVKLNDDVTPTDNKDRRTSLPHYDVTIKYSSLQSNGCRGSDGDDGDYDNIWSDKTLSNTGNQNDLSRTIPTIVVDAVLDEPHRVDTVPDEPHRVDTVPDEPKNVTPDLNQGCSNTTSVVNRVNEHQNRATSKIIRTEPPQRFALTKNTL